MKLNDRNAQAVMNKKLFHWLHLGLGYELINICSYSFLVCIYIYIYLYDTHEKHHFLDENGAILN
jgi:hypothetical protein